MICDRDQSGEITFTFHILANITVNVSGEIGPISLNNCGVNVSGSVVVDHFRLSMAFSTSRFSNLCLHSNKVVW